ncbi:MAG: CotH kinase family protein [Deltaproteobacteria bacterium]|nr:CotH kinase family protein [Deltaproteobacteria bacterium]
MRFIPHVVLVTAIAASGCAHEDGVDGADTCAPDAADAIAVDTIAAPDLVEDAAGDARGDDGAATTDVEAPDSAVTDASPEVHADDGAGADEVDATDTAAPPPSVPAINEVRCSGHEFVELANGGPTPAPIVGWSVGEELDDPERRWTFPAGTPPLAPGAFVVVPAGLEDVPAGIRSGLSCGRDVVRLWAPDGALVDTVTTIGNLLPDATWGRAPDATGGWAQTLATPGAANQPLVVDPTPFFTPTAVFEVDLALTDAAIEALAIDPYTWVPGAITLRRPTGEVHGPLDVGVRLKGRIGSFRPLPDKAGFKVKLDWIDDDLHVEGLRKLTFNNMVQDPSMLHEVVAYTIFRAAGVAAPSVGYAWVRVNGEDYGLYAHVETPDDYLLHRRDPVWFPTTEHVYEGEYGRDVALDTVDAFDVDAGDADARDDLRSLAEALAAAPRGPGYLDALAGLVDFAQMTREWAVEHWIGHWDGYTGPIVNNYYLHGDADGVFRMIPWGTDQTLSDRLPMDQAYGELFVRCLPDPACRALYVRAIIETTRAVAGLDLAGLIDEVAAATAPWVVDDPKRPYDLDTNAWVIDQTRDFIATRAGDLTEWLACADAPDEDLDGDGLVCVADCDDDDERVYPGALDACDDGIDQDCSGRIDDGLGCSDGPVVTRGAHRYLVSQGLRTWDDARAHCQAWGGDLVVFETAEEEAWLTWQAPWLAARDTWIGMTDREVEGDWRDVRGEPLGHLAWGDGQPDDWQGEDCASRWPPVGGRWNDYRCDTRLEAICETPCAPDGDGDDFAVCQGDGDDDDDAVHPGVFDTCGDLIDQDGNGRIDDGAGCPPSCDLVVIDDRGYRYCGERLAWAEARAACRDLGMDLVTTRSREESDRVFERSQALAAFVDGYWLGLSDIGTEGAWGWTTGAALVVDEAVWAGDQPDDWQGDEDCAAMWPWGEWNDYQCTSTALPFVCEPSCAQGEQHAGCP